MKNKLLFFIKIILALIIFATIAYLFYGEVFMKSERSNELDFCQPLDTIWYRVDENGQRHEIKLPVSDTLKNANVDIVETVLYDEIETGSCVSIRSSKQDMKIYIDNVLREEYSTKDTRLIGKTSVSKYIFVELDQKDAGKTLRIEITSDSKYLGTVKQVYYGDKVGIWLHYIEDNLISIIVSFVSIVLSIVSMVISIVYFIKTKKIITIFYYAIAVFLISMWMLLRSSIRQLFFNNISVLEHVGMICATLFMIPFLIYINRLQKSRYEKVYTIYIFVALCFSIVANMLIVLGVSEISQIVPINFALIGIGMIMFLVSLFFDIKNNKYKEYLVVAYGFLFLIITGILQMSKYFVRTKTFEGNVLSVGILVSMIVGIYHSLIEVQKINDEKETLEVRVNTNELKIEKLTYQAMETLANTIDAKDKYTNGHSNRVAKYSMEIARKLGKEERELTEIYFMGLLHDIGKIGVRDEIINKTEKLTDEEFLVIKNHPIIGYNILKNMTEIPFIENAARWHHERYDGSGYPDGLKGEEIPEYARVICIADAYDAMTSTRSYRAVMPQKKVREEIVKGMGKQFDPNIAQIMLEMIDEDIDYSMKELK